MIFLAALPEYYFAFLYFTLQKQRCKQVLQNMQNETNEVKVRENTRNSETLTAYLPKKAIKKIRAMAKNQDTTATRILRMLVLEALSKQEADRAG